MKKYSHKGLWERFRWVSLFSILFFAFLSIILIPMLVRIAQPDSVPYALHSVLSANYGADPRNLKHAALRLSIIADVIRDHGALAVSGFVQNETESILNGEPTLEDTNPYPVFFPTRDSASHHQQNTPVLGEIRITLTTQVRDSTLSADASQTEVPTLENLTPTIKVTQKPPQTSIHNVSTPTRTTVGHTTPAQTGQSSTTKPAATNTPAITASPQHTATQVTSLTAVSPTKTSVPTTKPPTSIPPSPTRTTPPPTPTSNPTQPPPTDTPIPTKPPPTNTTVPTKPPPTNTSAPTKPPDPYPPPPPPPPPPTDPTPYP